MTGHDAIAASFRMAKLMVHRMIDDLSPEEFQHQPVPGTNSAAWIVGHLALTFRRLAVRFGATELPAFSDELIAKLAATKKPAEAQSGLGDPAEMVRLFDACCDVAATVIATIPAEQLDGPSPIPIAVAKTLGDALLFVGGMHVAMHTGQLSINRRSLGKPPMV